MLGATTGPVGLVRMFTLKYAPSWLPSSSSNVPALSVKREKITDYFKVNANSTWILTSLSSKKQIPESVK